MANTRLLELLSSLTKVEKAAFKLFLKSPFFVQETTAVVMLQYFEFLMDSALKSSTEKVDKAPLHQLLFPGKPYSESRLEKVTKRLTELLEQFLVTNNYCGAKNNTRRELDLISLLREKGLNQLYERRMHALQQAAQNMPYESTERYHFQYLLNREEHEWKSNFNVWKNDLSIPETIQQLDLFYFSERIELLNRLLLQQIILSDEKGNAFLLGTDRPLYYEKYESESPLLYIRRIIQQLFLKKNPTKQDFEYILTLLTANGHHFPEETNKELNAFLRNICTYCINVSDNEVEKQALMAVLHKIHQEALKNGYFYHNGLLPSFAMMNITKIALNVKDKTWTKEFIDNHKDRILTDDSGIDCYHFCQSLYFFADKKFETSLDHLPFNTNTPFLMLLTRRLELMNLYELQSDLLLYKIDAFRKYLERTVPKSMSNYAKESNLIFTKLLRRLALIGPGKNRKAVQLEKQIQSHRTIADSLWLLEKVRNVR